MQARPVYPVDAVEGGCFVTHRYEIEPGQLICDLDTAVDALQPFGRLCVSELGVRMMANCLGLEIPERNVMEANARLREDNKRLKAECAGMRQAIVHVLEIADFVGLIEMAGADT